MTRLFDVTISGLGLLILAPVFLAASVMIRLDSKGPVFFRHDRIGREGRTFRMLKFRSMVDGAQALGPYFTKAGDLRITRTGAWLRKYSVDELPQLINVFLGDMSLVGPRPDVAQQVSEYTAEQRRLRLSVLPGITGLAQINHRHTATPQERMASDLRWVQERSTVMYLKILLRTVVHVVRERSF